MSDFKSSFAGDLSNMIELKVSLGGSASTYLPRATAFDAFCLAKHSNAGELSKSLALDWLKESMLSGNRVVNSHAAFLRGFAFYLNSIGKEAYSIPDRFMTGRDIFVPYIFTDAEMRGIFSAIDHFRYPRNPLLPLTLSTYFRLTYTCGLRPMEGRELKRSDVDLRTGEVQIVNSKRHRSRIVVMSDDMLSLMKRYTIARDSAASDSVYLFPNSRGIPYTAAFMQKKLVGFFRAANPDVPKEFLTYFFFVDLFEQVWYIDAIRILFKQVQNKKYTGGITIMGKYTQDATKLLELVGGKENIAAVSHCMTRMRFVLNDPALANIEAIEAIPSVKGSFTQAGQFQVIIGNTVADFYNDFTAVSGIEGVSKDEAKSAAKQNQNALQRVMTALAEIFAPLIPAIITGGLILGFRNVIDSLYIFAGGTATLVQLSQFWAGVDHFLWLIGEAVFHMLPVGICWSITKKMGTNQMLGIVLGLTLCSGQLLNAYGVAGATEIPVWDFGFAQVEMIGYQAQVIPAMLAGFTLVYLV